MISATRPRPCTRLTPARVASGAVALGATVASDCLLQPFFGGSLPQRAIGAAMAALFGVAGTHWALSREPTEWNALRGTATTGAVVLSWFTLCDRLAAMHPEGPVDSFASLVLPILLVAVAAIGGMIGTFFGLTAVVVVRPAELARAHRALDSTERVLVPAGGWLAAWGLLFVLLGHPRGLPPLVAALAGLAALSLVIARDRARLRFLDALFEGRVPGVTLARLAPIRAASGAPRERPSPAPLYGPYLVDAADGLLVERAASGGPYRALSPGEPIARLPLDRDRARRPIVRRITFCASLAAAIVVTGALRLDPACLRL